MAYLCFWYYITAIIRQLAALNDLVRFQAPLSHIQTIDVGRHHLEVMMISLM